jgi:hypothetical protein
MSGAEVFLQPFLISALDEAQWSAPRFRRFTTGESFPYEYVYESGWASEQFRMENRNTSYL